MNVTLSEFEYMKEGIVTDIISFLMNENNLSLHNAMNYVYDSNTFSLLANPETALFIQSSRYVYNELLRELKLTKPSKNSPN